VRGSPNIVSEVLTDPNSLPKWDKVRNKNCDFFFFFLMFKKECVGSYELERFNDRFTTMYVAFKGSMMGAAQTDFVLAQIVREFSDGTVRKIEKGVFFLTKQERFVSFFGHCQTATILCLKRRVLCVVEWKLEAGCLKRYVLFPFFFDRCNKTNKIADDPPRTRITSVQQVDYSGKVRFVLFLLFFCCFVCSFDEKANKRTMDAAKARIVAIVGFREYLESLKNRSAKALIYNL
jgi:hypothetical protein